MSFLIDDELFGSYFKDRRGLGRILKVQEVVVSKRLRSDVKAEVVLRSTKTQRKCTIRRDRLLDKKLFKRVDWKGRLIPEARVDASVVHDGDFPLSVKTYPRDTFGKKSVVKLVACDSKTGRITEVFFEGKPIRLTKAVWENKQSKKIECARGINFYAEKPLV